MSRMKPEDVIAGKGRPFTGAEYLESLRDGREVYIYGERVADVTAHPAFRNAARSIARLYDSLHDPKHKDVLTSPTDTGSGSFTHKFFRVAHSREDLIAQREAIAAWARMSYGWMGRTPDYKASLMNTLGVQYDFYDKFADNAKKLVPPRAGSRDVHEPRDRQSAGRPQQGGRPGARRVHHDPEGDRRRPLRLRRQGGGDLLGDHALQFPRPERRDAGERSRSRDHVHRADERAGREAVLPRLLRDDGERDGHAVRLSALLALRRERRDLRVRQRADPLGRRADLPRRREAQDVLSALRLRERLPVPGLHAARREARFPRRRSRQGAARHRRGRVPRQSGDARRDHRMAQPVLGDLGRDGDEPGAVERRRGAAECAVRLELPGVRRRCLSAREGDRREDHRVGADLPAVLREGFRESGRSTSIWRNMCAARTISTTASASRS